MDINKVAYDLALICTQRYLEECKSGDVSDTYVFSSGGDLAEKAAETFNDIYRALQRSRRLTQIY